MYLLLVGGRRASWWGSQGCKSVRRVVTSSNRKQAERDPGAQLYTQSRAFTPRKGCPHLGHWINPTAAKPVSFTGMTNIHFYGDLNPMKLTA